MTDRLYYKDSRLLEFEARVVESSADGQRVYLDRTAFYPSSGGQPFDTGTLSGVPVVEVVDEGERIAHLLGDRLAGEHVAGRIDAARRADHMQQHTGQHLLSAVFVELLNAPTLSFHLGAGSSTIEIGVPALSADQVRAVEHRANAIVQENRPVSISFEHAREAADLRKPASREGEIRIVTIAGLDRSACGGTHVESTAEIGPILIRGVDRVRGNVRVEFVCGGRALDRARRDYEALSAAARLFSSPVDDVPARVAAQTAALGESEKALMKMAAALGRAEGRHLYSQASPDAEGRRFASRVVPAISDEVRAMAQGFTAGEKARFIASAEDPPSVLLAVSADSGVDAGKVLKPLLAEFGGRGGGNATLAQGSVPDSGKLAAVVARLS